MGIIRRGTNAYYYESRRVAGRVVNSLVAKGEVAELLSKVSRLDLAARSDAAAEARADREIRREERAREAAGWSAWRADRERDERPVIEAIRFALAVADGSLRALGYRKRRGEWRRPRRAKMAETLGVIGDEPGGGPRGSMAELVEGVIGNEPRTTVRLDGGVPVVGRHQDDPDDRAAKEERIRRHLEKAYAFDPSALDTVLRALDQFRRHDARVESGEFAGSKLLRAMVACYGGDPVARAEDAVLRRLAEGYGLGFYTLESLRITLAAFKADLLGPSPSAVERVLVDSIGLAWMDLMESQERSAEAMKGRPELLEFLDRRLSRASKRLDSGLRTLALIRRKAAPSLAVQVNIAGPGEDSGPGGATKELTSGTAARSRPGRLGVDLRGPRPARARRGTWP